MLLAGIATAVSGGGQSQTWRLRRLPQSVQTGRYLWNLPRSGTWAIQRDRSIRPWVWPQDARRVMDRRMGCLAPPQLGFGLLDGRRNGESG